MPGSVAMCLRLAVAPTPNLNQPSQLLRSNPHSLTLQTSREDTEMSAAVRMRLIGYNKNASALGIDPIPGKSNYFVGDDPAQWRQLVD